MSLPAESSPDAAETPAEEQGNEPTDITFDEHLHPARPRTLRFRPRVKAPFARRSAVQDGPATGQNPAYVAWLLSQSMLSDANEISQQFSGQGSMWQNPYATPNSRAAVDTASVWFTAYPLSVITGPQESFLQAMADEDMWRAFAEIGIEGVHTGPVKRAGGISGWQLTPSVDGHFDRISTQIDPAFGTEEEFRQMCGTANWYGGTIIDDIVPGHTGKGADFRLAELKYADYPGIYHMVEIDPLDWEHLPAVPSGVDSVNIDSATEDWLDKAGYIIGRLAAGHLLRRRCQRDQLERDPPGGRHRRRRAALGVSALLQRRSAVHQLAGPVIRRHAVGDRGRVALAGRPRLGRTALGRQRIPRRGEDRQTRTIRHGRRATRCPRRPTT